MSSSMTSFALCLPSKTLFQSNHRFNFSFSARPFICRPIDSSRFSLSATVVEDDSAFNFAWDSRDKSDPDEYNGWGIEEFTPPPVEKEGLSTFELIASGASVAALVGLLLYFSLSIKGLRFGLRNPFDGLRWFSLPSLLHKDNVKSDNDEVRHAASDVDAVVSEAKSGVVSDESVVVVTETSSSLIEKPKLGRIVVPFMVDSAQQEAIVALKKLKVIEDDSRADELCTRREYARWLVRANSQLERSRKHRIISSAALSGSTIHAFDDVQVADPDFESIQSLAEGGVIRSKLSNGNVDFSPERFISRQDLISWIAKVEYKVVPGFNKETLRKNAGFLDVKEISSDVLIDIFTDTIAGEKSITRAVFGQSKRLQPNKPCTKAQVAVALTSGRMNSFVKSEIQKLEAEEISRQSEIKEVTSELLERGDITKNWEMKFEEERIRGLEIEKSYISTLNDLEHEKTSREEALAELIKQKAALDCQKQLLSSLKQEVDDMSQRLVLERDTLIEELRSLHDTGRNLHTEYDELVDKKSILEAEVEALLILRTWVEDEARKSEARAKVLEEARRRWTWER